MKKKLVGLLAGALMGSIVFAGSGAAAEDISGEWYLHLMKVEEQEYDPTAFGMEITLTLNEDGTAQVDSMGEITEGTWSETEEGWLLEADGELTVTLEDDILVVASTDAEDPTVMEFSREKPEAKEESPLITDAALEDFNGTWKLDSIYMSGMTFPANMFGESVTEISIEDGKITYHSEMDSGDEETGVVSTDFTVDGVFEDGVLSVEASEDTQYTSLKLQLHEDGTMSDGYTAPAEEEEETEIESETEADEAESEDDYEFDLDSIYMIYVRAE